MKTLVKFSMALLLTLSTACKETGSEKADGDGNSIDKIKKEAGDLVEAGKEAGKEAIATLKRKKDEFLNKHHDDIVEIEARIENFEARAAAASADVKASLKEKIEVLKKKKLAAQQKMAELSEKAPEAWEEFKDGTKKAVEELKQAVKDAKAEFDEKTEPVDVDVDVDIDDE